MLFSCTSRTENRMSAQMIPAAFPGLDYDNVFVWKITQAEVGLKGTKLWVWLQISELPVRGKNMCVACLGSPGDPGHQYLSTEQGAPRHVPPGSQPAALKASCRGARQLWDCLLPAQPVPPSLSVQQCCCQEPPSDSSQTGALNSSKETFPDPSQKCDLILTVPLAVVC